MKLLLSILFFTSIIISGFSQTDIESCGTRFSADHNFKINDYSSFRDKWRRNKNHTTLELPIVARIVRHTDQSGGLDPMLLEEIIDTLNKRYDNANIQFFECAKPDFVDVDEFYDFDRNIYRDSLITYNIPNVINIYFINKVLNDDRSICGYASFPWVEGEYVVVKNSCALNGSTVAHEIGHYLGLYHTHETSMGAEPANGQFCAISGDLLCDTPADPRLNSRNVDADCAYIGDQRDNNGDAYTPDPRNLMSYAPKACRDLFTSEQIERMNYYATTTRSHLTCKTTATENITSARPHITISPNPFKNSVAIDIARSGERGIVDILVTNAVGKTVLKKNERIGGSHTPLYMDLHNLPKGLYFITIKINAEISVHKIIKH